MCSSSHQMLLLRSGLNASVFHVLPVILLESTGTRVLDELLGVMLPCLMAQEHLACAAKERGRGYPAKTGTGILSFLKMCPRAWLGRDATAEARKFLHGFLPCFWLDLAAQCQPRVLLNTQFCPGLLNCFCSFLLPP